MNNNTVIKKLPNDVQSILRSSFNIYGYAQCVAELICNSLDADATCIAVRVDLNYKKIQVVDNGLGISKNDLQFVGERYMTSKCKSLSDLKSNLNKFGFRGEALASIIAMSESVTIVSRYKDSMKTLQKVFFKSSTNQDVKPPKDRPAHGTTITITNFMYNMQVRQRRIDPDTEIEDIRIAMENIALIHFNVSFSLRNDIDNSLVLQCHKNKTIQAAFFFLMDERVGDTLQQYEIFKDKYVLQVYIAKGTHFSKSLQFVYVNKRFVKNSEIQIAINNILLKKSFYLREENKKNTRNEMKYYQIEQKTFKKSNTNVKKYPVFIANLSCPCISYDISTMPDKSVVQFHDLRMIMMLIEKIVNEFTLKELGEYKDIESKVSSLSSEKREKETLDNSIKEMVAVALQKNVENFGASQLQNAVKGKPVRRKKIDVTTIKRNCTPHVQERQSKDKNFTQLLDISILSINKITPKTTLKDSSLQESDKFINIKRNNVFRETPFIKSQIPNLASRVKIETVDDSVKPIYNRKSAVRRFNNISLNVKALMEKILKSKNNTKSHTKTLIKHKYFEKTGKICSNSKSSKNSRVQDSEMRADIKYNTGMKVFTLCKNVSKKSLKTSLSKRDQFCEVVHKKSIKEYTFTLSKSKKYQLKKEKCALNFKSTYDLLNTIINKKNIVSNSKLYQNYSSPFYRLPEKIESKERCIQTEIGLKDFEVVYKYYNDHLITGKDEHYKGLENNRKEFKHPDSVARNENSQAVFEIQDSEKNNIFNRKEVNINQYVLLDIKAQESVIEPIKMHKSDESIEIENYMQEKFGLASNNINDFSFNCDLYNNAKSDVSAQHYLLNIGSSYKLSVGSEYGRDEYSPLKHTETLSNDVDFDNDQIQENKLQGCKNNSIDSRNCQSSRLFNDGDTYTIKTTERKILPHKTIFHLDKSLNVEFNTEFVSENKNVESGSTDLFKSIIDSDYKSNETAKCNNESNIKTSDDCNYNEEDKSYKFDDLNIYSTSGIENPMFIEKNVLNHTEDPRSEQNRSLTPEKCVKEWLLRTDSFGKIFYINNRTGMTLYQDPNTLEIAPTYKSFKRPVFVPKGMSPILDLQGKRLQKRNTVGSASRKRESDNRNIDELTNVKWGKMYHSEDMYDDFAAGLLKTTHALESELGNSSADMKNIPIRHRSILKEMILEKSMLESVEVINQVDSKFIAAIVRGSKSKSAGYIVLFDQHAVDERIRLEKLLKDYQKEKMWRSEELEKTLNLELGQSDLIELMKYKDSFSNLGLSFLNSKTNGRDIEVLALPSCIVNKNFKQEEDLLMLVEQFIIDEIQVLKSTKGNISSIPAVVLNVISSEACHGAIKFGAQLTTEKCKEMMVSLSKCDVPFQCAHGRPVMAALLDLAQINNNVTININLGKLKTVKDLRNRL